MRIVLEVIIAWVANELLERDFEIGLSPSIVHAGNLGLGWLAGPSSPQRTLDARRDLGSRWYTAANASLQGCASGQGGDRGLLKIRSLN